MSAPEAGALLPLRRGEWAAILVAVLIAHGFYARIVLYPSDFDAQNYLDIAQDIARQGLFSKFYYSNLRTYGYPLFLAFLRELAGGNGAAWRVVIFEVQLGAFIASAWMLRRSFIAISPVFARWGFIALVTNAFVLSYTPETLSESLAVTLVIAAAACWLAVRSTNGRAWPLVLAGTLLVSFSVMVRPANVYALAAWTVGILLLTIERRWRARTMLAILAALLIGAALPVLPQIRNNVANYDVATPLVVARLATNQQIWGIQYIKYATAMPPVPLPSVFYDNPFASAGSVDAAHPLRWYAQFPAAGIATLGLHVFNLLDQDLLFTYSRDLDPWYRVPVGVANHALIALALVGFALFATRQGYAIPTIALAVLIAAHVAVHAPTAVEMRFGLPLLALASPLAAFGVLRLGSARSRAATIATMVFLALYTGAALTLSTWVRSQSPAIVAWRAAHP